MTDDKTLDDGSRNAPGPQSRGRRVSTGAAIAITIAIAIGVTYAATGDPKLPHTSSLTAILDSRLLVAAARVFVFAALLYLLASIAVRVLRGEWVRGVGQVETDAPAQQLADDREGLQRRLEEALATIRDLGGRLEQNVGTDDHE